ncbi:mCG1044525, isoform CRA_b [Mus musculus]|nr:mCG1044525, isoform CRA_b [Mus musculus]
MDLKLYQLFIWPHHHQLQTEKNYKDQKFWESDMKYVRTKHNVFIS